MKRGAAILFILFILRGCGKPEISNGPRGLIEMFLPLFSVVRALTIVRDARSGLWKKILRKFCATFTKFFPNPPSLLRTIFVFVIPG